MILVLDEAQATDEIASGEHCCPCGGRLGWWGHARVRVIRQLDGSHTLLRPRRVACAVCRRTQVVLPAWSLPRRRDSTETVGAALLMATEGRGQRTIAAQLDRPTSTVRNWLRGARLAAERLRQTAVVAAYELDAGHAVMGARVTVLAEAVDALGHAAAAAVRRFGLVGASPWQIIAMISRGQLLTPLRPADRTGS
jgi:Domain of unknown function (DUF6431)